MSKYYKFIKAAGSTYTHIHYHLPKYGEDFYIDEEDGKTILTVRESYRIDVPLPGLIIQAVCDRYHVPIMKGVGRCEDGLLTKVWDHESTPEADGLCYRLKDSFSIRRFSTV